MHEKRFPNLARMARQFLGCPASSASVERSFSVAGQFFDDLRRQMDDEVLEDLMWAAIKVLMWALSADISYLKIDIVSVSYLQKISNIDIAIDRSNISIDRIYTFIYSIITVPVRRYIDRSDFETRN